MIGVVSALDEELAALGRRLGSVERRRLGGRTARFGRLGGREVCLLVGGVGRRAAEAGVAALFDHAPVEALIGIGVAGGLTADLGVGDLVDGARVVGAGGECFSAPAGPWGGVATVTSGRPGTLVTVDEIVASARSKARLAARLEVTAPAAVDLESAAWSAAAERRGLPWRVVRAVSDRMDEDLPVDFERFRTPAGGVSRARLAAHALVRPGLMLELDRLRRRVARCAERLADAAEELVSC